MRVRATRAFHTTLPDKITLPIIIVLIVMPPVYLCRRTPFMMISSLHVSKVMMLIMIMTTRRDCGSVCFMIISSLHVTMVMTVKICYDSKGYDEAR